MIQFEPSQKKIIKYFLLRERGAKNMLVLPSQMGLYRAIKNQNTTNVPRSSRRERDCFSSTSRILALDFFLVILFSIMPRIAIDSIGLRGTFLKVQAVWASD